MSKGLEALQDLSKLVFIHGGVEQYKTIEKELEAFEIFTKYAYNTTSLISLVTMMRFWEEDDKTITKELLETYDFPYTVEEYELLKEVLL